jgi:hypothetical protein
MSLQLVFGLFLAVLLAGITLQSNAWAVTEVVANGLHRDSCENVLAGKKPLITTYRDEMKRQWNYLDLLKSQKNRDLAKHSRRLLRAVQDHAMANALLLETDPQNQNSLLIKILDEKDLATAHPLARFAASLFKEYNGLRVEINPLKLKVDDAGALFDDEANRLTLALDNVLDLKSDSFVGHELRHAFLWHLVMSGVEHPFLGWLKRKPGTPPLQDTYPDEFSLDELQAYYYQVIDLLHESKTQPDSLRAARDFTGYVLTLLGHVCSDEISQFVLTYLKSDQNIKVTRDDDFQSVSIETNRYILQLDFLKAPPKTDAELKQKAIARMLELNTRTEIMLDRLQKVKALLEAGEKIDVIIEVLASRRDVIDPKI